MFIKLGKIWVPRDKIVRFKEFSDPGEKCVRAEFEDGNWIDCWNDDAKELLAWLEKQREEG